MKTDKLEILGSQTRRRFLRGAGAAAGSLWAAGRCLGRESPTGQESQSRSKSAKRRPFKLGLASYTLRKFTLDEALAMTQRVALDYICLKAFHLALDSSPDEIAEAVAKVKAAGIVLYGGGVIRMRDQTEVVQAFEYAKAAGMKTIVGAPSPELLPLVNQKVQDYDIQVAIHNHGPGDEDYPTPQSAYKKVEHLDKRLGLCIDIGHTVRIGADPILDAERFSDRLLDVHIKDVSAAAPEGKTLEIGRGVIDIPEFLRTLIRTNYSGVVSFEYEKDADDPLPGLAESVGYVKGALAAL